MSQLMLGEFLLQFFSVIGEGQLGFLRIPHTSWLAKVKNDLSYPNLSVEEVSELALNKPLCKLLAASEAMV